MRSAMPFWKLHKTNPSPRQRRKKICLRPGTFPRTPSINPNLRVFLIDRRTTLFGRIISKLKANNNNLIPDANIKSHKNQFSTKLRYLHRTVVALRMWRVRKIVQIRQSFAVGAPAIDRRHPLTFQRLRGQGVVSKIIPQYPIGSPAHG